MIPEKAANKKRKEQKANVLDRRKLSQETRDNLRSTISNVDDPEAKAALEVMFEVMTGENP